MLDLRLVSGALDTYRYLSIIQTLPGYGDPRT